MTPHSPRSDDDQSTGGRSDWWSRRPRRSRNDRKVAGVAGGLGRAFGIDPIIIRIAFAVLAIFGGSGVLLYALCWLLLPADGDQVSALEGLIGRGQTSVSSFLTVCLIAVVVSSAGSVFSWGLPFWPVVIGAVIVFALARRGRIGRYGPPPYQGGGNQDWNQWGNDVADRATRWANGFADRASQWGQQPGRWPGQSSSGRGTGNPGGAASPFEHPAFWDAYSQDWRAGHRQGSPTGTPSGATGATGTSATGAGSPGQSGRKPRSADPAAGGPAAPAASRTGGAAATNRTMTATSPDIPNTGTATDEPPSPSQMLAGNRTPPAWDPLGVAPFAWDLPDPTPVASQPELNQERPDRGRSVVSRVFGGLALIGGALAAVGVIAGWWALSWAEVSAIALTIVAVGLIIGALRGRGRSLIGPGIFLAILTLALTVTGIRGTDAFGEKLWTPTTADEVNNHTFSWNAGDGTLDLSALVVPPGETVTTTVDVRAGQATVIVPNDVKVQATCSANVGEVDCLTAADRGMRPSATGTQSGSAGAGTLDLTVKVGAGQATVRTND